MNQNPVAYDSLKRDVDAISNMQTSFDTGSNVSEPTSFIEQYTKPPYVFIPIAILLTAVLWYMQPSFVMEPDPKNPKDPKDPEGEQLVLSYKKLIISVVIVTAVMAGIWYYQYGSRVEKSN